MIKTIFYLVAILLSLAAAFFGFQNNTNFKSQQEAFNVAEQSKKQFNKNNDDVQGELDTVSDKLATANKFGSEQEATLEASKSDQKTLQRSLAQVESEIEGYDDSINEVARLIAEVRQMFPDGDIDEIPSIITNLEEGNKQNQKALDEKILLAGKLSSNVSRNNDEVGRLDGKISEIRKRIRGNAIEARVSSVDNRWGFCVINGIGSNNGIKGDAGLLVHRGNRLIGRLKISSLEPNQIVADMDPRSMAKGMRVSAGDRVILETPAGN